MKQQTFLTQLIITSVIAILGLSACGGSPKTETADQGVANTQANALQEAEQYMGMAGMAISEGNEQEALANYLTAAKIYDNAGAVTIERAEAHFLAAGILYKLTEYIQAIEEYEKSVDIYTRFSGNSQIKAANALNNMGTIYKELLKKTRAVDCWTRALEIYKAAPAELQNQANMQMIEQNIRDLEQGF
jgi:tetratricopeptide (TPR) repeat protein